MGMFSMRPTGYVLPMRGSIAMSYPQIAPLTPLNDDACNMFTWPI